MVMKIVMMAEVTAEKVIGGAERVLRNQALGLAALGHHVELLTRAPEGAAEDAIMIGGIRERRYVVDRTHEASFVWSSVRRSVEAFDRLRRTEPLDAVVVHQALAGLGPIVSRRQAASRWVYVCHSLAHEEFATRRAAAPSNGLRRYLNGHARRWIERTVMGRCDQVVVLSEYMRRRVMEAHDIPAERIVLIPGATDPQAFTPVADRKTGRGALCLPTHRRVLFTVRNLVPRMGLENVLDAMALSRTARETCTVVIGGEGPLRATLEAGIRKRGLAGVVRLIGFVPETRLTAYYQTADVVLMPSLQLEGFGLVTVEAMACGTPVVGTPVGAIPEILNQVDPILVTHGTDGRSLATALEALLQRIDIPGEYERLAGKGRALIEQRYNWTRHCADLAGLLDGKAEGRQAA
jgi:glycosyltransferase involved in cell wall biosynthesis